MKEEEQEVIRVSRYSDVEYTPEEKEIVDSWDFSQACIDTYAKRRMIPTPMLTMTEIDNSSEGKYYTPSIEDIRVGYECERLSYGESKSIKSWYPYIIKEFSTFGEKPIDFSIIRTPYLTKEQIEADGWKLKDNVIGFNVPVFEKNNHWIMWYEKEKFLKIMPIDPSKEKFIDKMDIWMLYQGECKCINTFRTICKLLNIK
jgi:hypothetical protein